jgi:hypothetical protein
VLVEDPSVITVWFTIVHTGAPLTCAFCIALSASSMETVADSSTRSERPQYADAGTAARNSNTAAARLCSAGVIPTSIIS